MDLSGIERFIPNVAAWLHIDPTTVVFLVGIFMALCNVVGRRIPDDRKGIVGLIRDVAKFIGAYSANKITSNVTTVDVAKGIIESRLDNVHDKKLQTVELSDVVPAAKLDELEATLPTPAPVPAFPGLMNRKIEEFPQEFK